MRCPHPLCTGCHDNNKFAELCPRSRAAKRIKDWRYIHNNEITQGIATKGFAIQRHREALARYRQAVKTRDTYARRFGDDFTSDMSYWERSRADEMERFRARREGNRGTRCKIDAICAGRNGVITVREVIAATRNPGLRTWYPSW